MRTLLVSVLVVLVLFVAGCGGNEGKPIDKAPGSGSTTGSTTTPTVAGGSGSGVDAAIVELERYREKMCACTDIACSETVFKEFAQWRQDFRKANVGRPKPSAEQEKTGNDINRALMQCRIKLSVTAGKGSGSAGSGSGSAAADPIATALRELDGFKTRMCACTDKACGDKLQLEIGVWQRNTRTAMTEKPNKLQEVRGNAIEKELKECRKKAEAATPGIPGGASKIDSFLTQMQGHRDKICACTTKPCAVDLRKAMDTWLATASKDIADAKPTKDQDDKADRLESEMKTCVGKLK